MQAVRKIEALYGPFSDEEINHYKKKLTKDGRPCLVLSYRVFPRYDYTNLH